VATVVVGGSGKDVGKTALVCAIIAALKDFAWTAVKITGHDYEPGLPVLLGEESIREETSSNGGTDTARYLSAGARRSLLVTRQGAEVPLGEIQRAVGADRNVIYESNRIVDVIRPDVAVALIAGSHQDWKASFVRFHEKADAVVSSGDAEIHPRSLRSEVAHFASKTGDPLSADMEQWLREKLRD